MPHTVNTMPVADGRDLAAGPNEGGRSLLVIALWVGTAVTVLAAGLLLWSSQGEALFLDMVASAFAMCF